MKIGQVHYFLGDTRLTFTNYVNQENVVFYAVSDKTTKKNRIKIVFIRSNESVQ